MPGSSFIVSENITLTAKAMDDISPNDIGLYETKDEICEHPNKIKLMLSDTGSGLADGIKVKYGMGTSSTVEPNNYTIITPIYNEKDKIVDIEIEIEHLVEGDNLWIVPVNYKDVEGNINDHKLIIVGPLCSESS